MTWLAHTDIFNPAELADVMANNAERVYFKPANVAAARQAVDPVMKGFKY